MRLPRVTPFVIAAASLLASPAFADKPTDPAVAAPIRPKLAITRYTLDNGLRVVLNPDTTAPTVAVCIWYDVGSRNEQPGEGGFAHLFEHMMFEGSDGFPRGVHSKVVEARGGKLNASTAEDWTRYWEMMPSGELETTLILEADRMKSLHVTEEAFENQRKVVEEEYRMRVENTPYVKGYFRLMELVYEGYHPYAHPAIGSMQELDAAKLEWVKAFHDSHYAPNNAVLVIAGDFALDDAKALVKKHFESIPKATIKKFEDVPFAGRTKPSGPEPSTDAFARTPEIYFGWAIPKDGEKEHYALEMAAEILSGYESARLDRKLVKELGVVQHVGAEAEGLRGPDAFVIEAQLAEKGKIEDIEKIILATVAELAKNGPTDAELKKARAKVEHSFMFGLQTNLSRALELAKFENERGDATLLETEPDKFLAVTAADVKAAVAKYLVKEKLAHVRVLPPVKAAKSENAPDKLEKKVSK